jgi:hypothetical protein
MPAHTSHILQPLDVSCFGPLKKVYGSQIEIKMRLSVNHITKEEFLPTFLTAHRQVMTTENITSGFRATGLMPFDPQRVLDKLGPIIESYSFTTKQPDILEPSNTKDFTSNQATRPASIDGESQTKEVISFFG